MRAPEAPTLGQPGAPDQVRDRRRAVGPRVPDERIRERALAGRDEKPVRRRGSFVRRVLLVCDLTALATAFFVTQIVFDLGGAETGWYAPGTEALLFLASLPGWVVLAKIYGLYSRHEERTEHSTADDAVGVFHTVTLGAWLVFIFTNLVAVADPHVGKAVTFWALAIALVLSLRVAGRGFCRRRLAHFQNTVIVGTGQIGQLVARKHLNHPEWGVDLLGFVDTDMQPMNGELEGMPLLGPPERLSEIVREYHVDRVVFAFTQDSHQESLDLVSSLKDLDVQVDIVPRLFEVVGPTVDVHTVEGMPLIGLRPLRLSRSSLFLKRSMDIAGATLGLLTLLPLLLYIALRVKLDSPGPVFYRGDRVGRNGKTFRLYKFRTMKLEHCRGEEYGGDRAEEEFERIRSDPEKAAEFARTHKFVDDPRVTQFGRFLRRTSLDELPQLINVVLGDLALVGPRAITCAEHADLSLGRLTEHDGHAESNAPRPVRAYWEIQDLRPGVTGYWQVTARSGTDYEERRRLDMVYVTSWSLKLDLVILSKTVRAVLGKHGAY